MPNDSKLIRHQDDDGTVFEGARAHARLMQLGFRDPRVVRQALQDGASAGRSSMSPGYAPAYAGQRMWGETTASLHVYESPFMHEMIGGVSLVLDRERGIAIIVTSGDNCTGHSAYKPQVRYDRADVITGLVNNEFDQLWNAVNDRVHWQVWFLLHLLDAPGLVVPAELSLPTEIGPTGLVVDWSERIIISAYDDRDVAAMTTPETEPEVPAPVVMVRRRAS